MNNSYLNSRDTEKPWSLSFIDADKHSHSSGVKLNLREIKKIMIAKN